jgi:hypothetical protein
MGSVSAYGDSTRRMRRKFICLSDASRHSPTLLRNREDVIGPALKRVTHGLQIL